MSIPLKIILTLLILIVILSVSALIFNITSPLLNLISVLIGALISLSVTIYYKDYDIKRERESTEKDISTALKEELNENINILNRNIPYLYAELKATAENDFKISCLEEFKTDFWNIIKLNVHEVLGTEISKELGDSSSIMERINAYIRIKENYKIINYHNQIDSEIIEEYDNYLIKCHCRLLKKLDDLFKLLESTDFNKKLGKSKLFEYTYFSENLDEKTDEICVKFKNK